MSTQAIDNDTVLRMERVIAATPERLFALWSEPEELVKWWGPEGFSCRTKRIDLRGGGEWVFDMIAPDGTVFPNHHHPLPRRSVPGPWGLRGA